MKHMKGLPCMTLATAEKYCAEFEAHISMCDTIETRLNAIEVVFKMHNDLSVDETMFFLRKYMTGDWSIAC